MKHIFIDSYQLGCFRRKLRGSVVSPCVVVVSVRKLTFCSISAITFDVYFKPGQLLTVKRATHTTRAGNYQIILTGLCPFLCLSYR